MERAARLGFVAPGGGAEHEYYHFAESTGNRAKVFIMASRIGPGEEDHDIDSLLGPARIDWINEAARRMISLKPDCAMWACTSGSFVVGRAGAEAQVAALAETTGVPAGSTSLAFIDALQALGMRRVAVLATYPEPAARAFEAFLGEFGVEIVHLHWLDAGSGWDAALLPPERVIDAAKAAAVPEAETVLIPDTAMPSLDLIAPIEEAIGRPVLTANQVTLWQAVRLSGRHVPVDGHGRLFALDQAIAAQ